MKNHYNVLFLCTGNSSRSIMAEAILNFKGKPRFRAYSAGSHPSGKVRPEALRQIELAKMSVEGLRSKSWDEFTKPGSPQMDFIFTVCDNAAKEPCPIWLSDPSKTAKGGAADLVIAHWGVPDPAPVQGPPQEIERAFRQAFTILERRISVFLSLPLASLDQPALKQELDKIGQQ
jgi:arsenate reductase